MTYELLSTDPGMDYSTGQSNRNTSTGISYGIISLNALHTEVPESFDLDYGEPSCPRCGGRAVGFDSDRHDNLVEANGVKFVEYTFGPGCADFVCEECKYVFDGDLAYSPEPLGSTYGDGGYSLTLDTQGDVWVIDSSYYTYAQYCSPCAPGAGHLEHPCAADCGAPRTYCLAHGWWFEDGIVPYPVYRVIDDSLVQQGKL